MCLKINPENTFEYYIHMPMARGLLKGNWTINGDTLLLDVIKPIIEEKKDDKITEYIEEGEDRTITVLFQDTIPFVGNLVILNNLDTLVIGLDGKVKIGNLGLQRVEILGYFLEDDVVFYLDNDTTSSFLMNVYGNPGVPFLYVAAIETWLIKGKKLYPLIDGRVFTQDYSIMKRYPLKQCLEFDYP
jgi:hypothetical protein